MGRVVLYCMAEGLRVRAAAGVFKHRFNNPGGNLFNPDLQVPAAVDDDDGRLQLLSDKLWRGIYAFAPRVEPDGPTAAFAGLHLTAGFGKAELLAELGALAERLCPQVADTVVVGVAGTHLAARLAAHVAARAAVRADGRPGRFAERSPLRLEQHGLEIQITAASKLCVAYEVDHGWVKRLPVSDLWPLEPTVIQRLRSLGLRTIGEAAAAERQALVAELGSIGNRVFELANGVDRLGVRSSYPPVEISAEFGDPDGLQSPSQVQAAALVVARKVAASLQARGDGARELWLVPVGHGAVGAIRRFATPVTGIGSVQEAARALATKALQLQQTEPEWERLSLIARDLVPVAGKGMQHSIWSAEPGYDERRSRITQLLVDLHRRFPGQVVRSGKHVGMPRRERMLAYWDPHRWHTVMP